MDEIKEKLDAAKADYIEKLKRLALLEAGVDYSDVDNYVKYLTADNEEEIAEEAEALAADLKAQNTARTDVYHDRRSFNPFK